MEKIELEIAEIITRKATDMTLMMMLREKHGTRSLPVMIGLIEAQSIAMTVLNVKLPRPGIYDLYLKTISSLDVTIDSVYIYKIEDGVFYSCIYVEREGNIHYVDARTSDAVALAQRAGAPIYVDRDLFERHCAYRDGNSFSFPITTASVEVLREAMQRAIENEEYELAAKLRDELKSRNPNND